MTDKLNFCEICGAQLVRGGNFCESCGAQVRIPPAPQPVPTQVSTVQVNPPPSVPPRRTPAVPAYTHAPAYTVPAASPAKSSSILWIVLGAGGCLGFLCIVLLVASVIFFNSSNPMLDEFSSLRPAEPTQPVIQPAAPEPEQPVQDAETPQVEAPQVEAPPLIEAAQPEPTLTEPDLTELIEPDDPPSDPIESAQPEEVIQDWPGDIDQEMNDSYFTDDFSTTKYDWANTHDEVNYFGYEDGHYALHVLQSDYTSWAYLPTDFDPTTIGFDAAVVQGYERGAFGVLCHYQDEQNFHFVSIDPLNKEYSIGYLQDDEYIELMQNMWMPSLFLHDSPYAVNNFLIACDPDMITLFINNELEAQASTGPQTGGRMAISGETWEDMAPAGFKTLFDNIFAYIQVQ